MTEANQQEHSREALSLASGVQEHMLEMGAAQVILDGWTAKKANNSRASVYSHNVRVRIFEEGGRTQIKIDDAVTTRDERITQRQLLADDTPLFDQAKADETAEKQRIEDALETE